MWLRRSSPCGSSAPSPTRSPDRAPPAPSRGGRVLNCRSGAAGVRRLDAARGQAAASERGTSRTATCRDGRVTSAAIAAEADHRRCRRHPLGAHGGRPRRSGPVSRQVRRESAAARDAGSDAPRTGPDRFRPRGVAGKANRLAPLSSGGYPAAAARPCGIASGPGCQAARRRKIETGSASGPSMRGGRRSMPDSDRDFACPVAAHVTFRIHAGSSVAVGQIARTHKAPRLPVAVP